MDAKDYMFMKIGDAAFWISMGLLVHYIGNIVLGFLRGIYTIKQEQK